MTQDCRHKRVRLLVHKLNKARKQQAKQIDILCHDLIGAQRNFIQRLDIIRFAGSFYKSLIGVSDQKTLLHTVAGCMHEVMEGTCIVFFLKQSNAYKSHTIPHSHVTALNHDPLEHYFNDSLLDSLCRMHQPCGFDDMVDVGLQVDAVIRDQLTALTMPIIEAGRSLGLILLYRHSNNLFTELDIEHVKVVAGGMSCVMQAGCLVSYDRHDEHGIM